MNNLQEWDTFNEGFLNRDKLELLPLQAGMVYIINKEIDLKKDINFKKTAKSWFGRNISSGANLMKHNDRGYKAGTILFACVQGQKGYVYGFDFDTSEGYLSDYYSQIDEWRHEFLTIAFEQNLIDVVPYEETELTEEIESLKYSRIWDNVNSKKTRNEISFFNKNEILDIVHEKPRYIISCIDPESRKETEKYHIRNLLKEKFTKEDGTLITGFMYDENFK
jgi:hypothetical protein